MNQKDFLVIHPADNIIPALNDLPSGRVLDVDGKSIVLIENITAKHKFALQDFGEGDEVIMYGVCVGKATTTIYKGAQITTENIKHATGKYSIELNKKAWNAPDISRFEDRTFNGYHRSDGRVGTGNYWIVLPLVFCENRNIKAIEKAMHDQLGYENKQSYRINLEKLKEQYTANESPIDWGSIDIIESPEEVRENRTFKNVDGIKFLYHDMGCGETRQDSNTLCRLLADYITHPNVAGATVLSLGCQNAQVSLLQEAIADIDPDFDKPLVVFEQQQSTSEPEFIANAVKQTFAGLVEADKLTRRPAPLSELCVGLECGGSDGFSGLSANPALGYTSDLIVALGGKTILAEFPELNGVEQELINRCVTTELAEKFSSIMKAYSKRAEDAGSGFEMNPSPGNIKDGLITDAIKSAGAAKKGGTSPIRGVLDYTERAINPGLHLLCTPGGDVESTTALAGAGANLMVFTTGLGTPTGNPISPVIKMSTNTKLSQRMADIIDINAGDIIEGTSTIAEKGEELLELIIKVASGEYQPKAVQLGQDDFIPWKRNISL